MTNNVLKYCITALLLLLASGNSLFAQSNIVFGTVTDKDNQPMEYVSVSLLNSAKPTGTVTDKYGKYNLKIPTNGNVTIRFSFTGYESQDFSFAAEGNTSKELNCKMLPSSQTLDAVTVREERSRETSFTPVKIDKLDELVGPVKTVESLIKTLADVSSNNEMSSQYSVRGGSFDENLVYINDVEIYRPFLVRSGQQEGLSIINPDMVSNILFSPGGFDAKYGDKMSSVLDITYRRPVDKLAGQVSISMLGGS
ncbi:MAG: carboxypeptidase-like regulatory domain-containing protein, partial [Bacteroidales bacterium]|nr:carboxypeptidase-like regulatory domain-containing protein [Bacteroidales bacterium]